MNTELLKWGVLLLLAIPTGMALGTIWFNQFKNREL